MSIRIIGINNHQFDIVIGGYIMRFDTPYHYIIDDYIRYKLNELYSLIYNGLTQNDIENLIVVNIVGYKRARTWLDIRYTLTPQGTSVPLIRNVDFEVRSDQYKEAFDLAINQCIEDFESFRLNLIDDESFSQQFENLLKMEKFDVWQNNSW